MINLTFYVCVWLENRNKCESTHGTLKMKCLCFGSTLIELSTYHVVKTY